MSAVWLRAIVGHLKINLTKLVVKVKVPHIWNLAELVHVTQVKLILMKL